MPRRRELLISEWAVLALLCEGPAHGYAIGAAMAPDGELGRIWSVKQPLTYRTIDVLKSRGLVEVAAVRPGDQAPQRTELKATAAGRRLVDAWLDEPVSHVRDLRPALLLKLHLLRRRRRSPVCLLTAQREILREQAVALEAEEPEDLLRWRQTMTDAALRFVEESLEREGAPA